MGQRWDEATAGALAHPLRPDPTAGWVTLLPVAPGSGQGKTAQGGGGEIWAPLSQALGLPRPRHPINKTGQGTLDWGSPSPQG